MLLSTNAISTNDQTEVLTANFQNFQVGLSVPFLSDRVRPSRAQNGNWISCRTLFQVNDISNLLSDANYGYNVNRALLLRVRPGKKLTFFTARWILCLNYMYAMSVEGCLIEDFVSKNTTFRIFNLMLRNFLVVKSSNNDLSHAKSPCVFCF